MASRAGAAQKAGSGPEQVPFQVNETKPHNNFVSFSADAEPMAALFLSANDNREVLKSLKSDATPY